MSSETANSPKRPYTLKARADRQEDTRHRIAAATAELHAEVGPARTTIAEIARRAGVQRPTVYNNFPTERGLLAACQDHFLAEHPPPDLTAALGLTDPERRVADTPGPLYGWYRATAAMTGNVQRDRRLVPELDALLAETGDRVFDGLADELARAYRRRGNARAGTRAAIRLALDFPTWQRLTGDGLTDAGAA